MSKRKATLQAIAFTACCLGVMFLFLTTTRAYEDFKILANAESVTLEFSENGYAHLDFDNNGLGPFNHKWLHLSYDSTVPEMEHAYIVMELYVDENGDGTYRPCAENRKHTCDFERGATMLLHLPYGISRKNYRFVVTNETPAVQAAIFTLSTY